MRIAIRESRRGFPAPNPHVGCVIVKNGENVGQGHHAYAGGPHAEVVALREAGSQAFGATAYVTLEPCHHTGRTGPCTQALLQAGVARVVVACRDPNPVAAGGMEALERSGIATDVGVLESAAAAVNFRFLAAMRLARPFVTIKAAITLDGRIALDSGESKWITGEAARRAAHRLRAEHAAILVGRGTIQTDDPALTARIPGVRNQPVRVLLDSANKLDREHRAFREEGRTLHLTAERMGSPGPWSADRVLTELWSEGLTSVLVEGGGKTIASFVRSGLADRLELFVAPVAFGQGAGWTADLGLEAIPEAPRWDLRAQRRLGADLHLTYEPSQDRRQTS